MASARRIEKINQLVREVLSEVLAREFSVPGRAMLTVTRVEAAEDLAVARVFVTVLADGRGVRAETLAELVRATPDFQHALNRKLRMRPVPRIVFLLDRDEERRERVERLLAEQRDEHS